jgi:MFS family permease
MHHQVLMTEKATAPPPLFTRSFASLLIAQAAFGYSFSSFILLPKYLATELSAGATEIGLVTAAGGAATIVCLFATGAVVDRFGRRRFLTAGAVIMALASLAFALVDRVGPLMFGLRALQGASFAMALVAGGTLAVDQAPPERLGQAIGIFGLTMISMNALAPSVVESVAEHMNWASAFVTAAAGAALSCGLSFFVQERPPARRAGDEVPGFIEVARRPRLLLIGLVIAVVGAAFGSVVTFSQPLALEVGIEKVRSLFVAYAATAIVARVGLGRTADRLGRYPVSVVSLAVYACVVTLMIWLRPGWLAPLGAVFGLAHGLFYPAFNALAVEDAGPADRGKVMALFQGWFNVGFAGGAFALGFLAEAAGYPAVFAVSGLAMFAALLLLATSPWGRALRIPRGAKRSPERVPANPEALSGKR